MPTVRYTVVHGEVIAEKRDGVRRQYVPDSLGSTVALQNSAQVQTDTFVYWPYGEQVSRTGTTPTPFRYVGTRGYYRDSPARTYVRARRLDTVKARWLTADPFDPFGLTGGDPNLYRYVHGNPTSLVDPSGLRCWHLIWHWCIGNTCHLDPWCRQYRPPGPPQPGCPPPLCPTRPRSPEEVWRGILDYIETVAGYSVGGTEFVEAAKCLPVLARLSICEKLAVLYEDAGRRHDDAEQSRIEALLNTICANFQG